MKILVISHNVFGKTTNMGITLSKFFEGFDSSEISQLYIHSEIPTSKEVCVNYFRLTDKDALKTIAFHNNVGTVFLEKDIKTDVNNSRVDRGVTEKVYRKASALKSPSVYMSRDLMWRLSHWYTKQLKEWLESIDPDVIYLASGDYGFIYNIAKKIALDRRIPLLVACFDDYYINNKNNRKILGRIRQKIFMKTVKETVTISDSLITFCEKMQKDYSYLFKKKCYVLYTPAEQICISESTNPNKIAYFGTLGLKRDDQLVEIGKAIKETSNFTGVHALDVYTSEKRIEALTKMIPENGIKLHSAVSRKEMIEIFSNCLAVVHTESFDPIIKNRVAYSISTKIPESLTFGPCLLVYGPSEIASVEYLKEHNAAFIANDRDQLSQTIVEMVTNNEKRTSIIHNARQLSHINHNPQTNYYKLMRYFNDAIKNYSYNEG